MSKIQTFFDENGYYLAKGVFSVDEISSLENEFDRIVGQLEKPNESDPNHNGVISTRNVQQYSSLWLTALLHKGFLDIVEQFIGPDIVLNHSTLFEKRQTNGETPFKMHQDWSYLPTQKNTMIAGMIHVSEATEEIGCLRVYPGSHKHGRMETSKATDAEFHDKFPFEGAVPIEAEPGDVTFFDYFIVHGSMSNRSERPQEGRDCEDVFWQGSERRYLSIQRELGVTRMEPPYDCRDCQKNCCEIRIDSNGMGPTRKGENQCQSSLRRNGINLCVMVFASLRTS